MMNKNEINQVLATAQDFLWRGEELDRTIARELISNLINDLQAEGKIGAEDPGYEQ